MKRISCASCKYMKVKIPVENLRILYKEAIAYCSKDMITNETNKRKTYKIGRNPDGNKKDIDKLYVSWKLCNLYESMDD